MRNAIVLVLIAIASVQVGAAVAKDLFDTVDPTHVVWLRLTTAGVILLLAIRPRVRGYGLSDWALVAALGLSVAAMNVTFYQAFAHIPLGVAVTLEFIGPLSVALAFSRRARDLIWVVCAGVGVALLGFRPEGLTWTGAGLALLAGGFWAAYIVLSKHVGARWSGLDGAATAAGIAAVSVIPLLLTANSEGGWLTPHVLVVGAAVGLLSSVIPYTCELVALRSLSPGIFGVLLSLEPATAALAGLAILGEHLTGVQWIALVFVAAASAGVTKNATKAVPLEA